MTQEFSKNELSEIGKAYTIKKKLDGVSIDLDNPSHKNAKMKLMMFMDTINNKLQKYDPPKKDFVRSIKTTQKVYTNRSKQLFLNSHNDKQNSDLQKMNLSAIDQFRKHLISLGKLNSTGVNWTAINPKTGLPGKNDNDSISRNYDQQWILFAANYPHPDFEEDHKAALNTTLNDPGDFDQDGNTLDPSGTAQAYVDKMNATPQDLNHDGVLDDRDRDLADGFVDNPENFSQEELAGLTDKISEDVLHDLNELNESDFQEPEINDWDMTY